MNNKIQYSLSSKDSKLCKSKKNKKNCLIFGIMLAYFKNHTKFPTKNNLPINSIIEISNNLNIETIHSDDFKWDNRTAERYRQEIRDYLGYRIVNNEDVELIIDFLIKEFISNGAADIVLLEQTRLYFTKNKIEIVSNERLEIYISNAKSKFEKQFFQQIFDSLSSADYLLIDTILNTELDTDNSINLAELKKDIPGAKLKNISFAIQKINLLSKIKLPELLINSVDRKVLLKYYERINAIFPSNILKFSPISKYAHMAIFFHIRLELMLDSLVDVMIKLLKRARTNSDKYVEKNILSDVKRVGGKFDILSTLAILNVDNPKGIIEDKVYPTVPQSKLQDVIVDLSNSGGKWYQKQVQGKMHKVYVYGSRVKLLSILRELSLSVDHEDYNSILQATHFINKYWDASDSPYYVNIPPIIGVITSNWHGMVVSTDEGQLNVNKYNYEIAVFERLMELLIVKSVWVHRSYRYRDPNKDLLDDFDENYENYCKLIGLPTNADKFVDDTKNEVKQSLEDFNSNILDNDKVDIVQSKNGGNIKLTPLSAQEEPANIIKLQQEISNEYSMIHLLDVLKECDLRINFISEFQTIGKISNIEFDELQKRLLLCIFAIGSNTGLKRLSLANDDINYSDLRYVKGRYINASNIRNAIGLVVNKVFEIRNPDIWGKATTTVSCDSTHLFAWDQNLMSEWHFRYRKKGVMIYWHVDEKSLCIYSQLKDCTSSEVGSMIKGFLDHDTEMDIEKIFVDTHGQSVIGFAISKLLGFDLCPRLKAINKQKIFFAENGDKDKYQNISPILKSCIDWKLINDNYKEVVRHIAALKLGQVSPSVMIKRFSKGNFNHPVYKALIEIGKANKTIFLCKYLSSEEFRQETNAGLNVVERLNHVMDFIFYGKLGQISTNNIVDQELSVLCLHLLQVCMVYINTLIIQEILSKPHWQNKLTLEDYRALTPLFSGHINPYGLFLLDLAKRIKNI
jgi:TnpA family transposase